MLMTGRVLYCDSNSDGTYTATIKFSKGTITARVAFPDKSNRSHTK